MSTVVDIDMTGPIGPHGTSLTVEKLREIKAGLKAERERVERLIANTEAVNHATGRLGLLCATSRPALRLNAGLQRAFKHDALVSAGVLPAKLTGRQMDAV